MLTECSAVVAEQLATSYLQKMADLVAADAHEPGATTAHVMDAAEMAAVAMLFRLAYRRGGSRSVRMLQCLVDNPADHPMAAWVA